EFPHIPAGGLLVHAFVTFQRFGGQVVLRGALLELFPVKGAGIVQPDHPVEAFARFTDGDHHKFIAQTAQQKSLFGFQHSVSSSWSDTTAATPPARGCIAAGRNPPTSSSGPASAKNG